MDLCSLYDLCDFLRSRCSDTGCSYGAFASELNHDPDLRDRTRKLLNALDCFEESIRVFMKQIDEYTCYIPEQLYDYLACGELDSLLLSPELFSGIPEVIGDLDSSDFISVEKMASDARFEKAVIDD